MAAMNYFNKLSEKRSPFVTRSVQTVAVILRPRKLQRNFGIFKQFTVFAWEAG